MSRPPPPRFLEPQGPPCLSTGILAACPRPPPLFGFLPQPSMGPEGPASAALLPLGSQAKATAEMPS